MITIILPIFNEAKYINRTLDAILNQDYPRDQLEILIVDGMSNDGTREILASYQSNHQNISIVDNPKRIVPTGMNLAIEQAKGDVIIRVDGHTEIAPDYVSQCVYILAKSGAENVGGKMTAIGTTKFGEAVGKATSHPFGIGNARFHYSDKTEEVDSVYLGAWSMRVFEKIGLFDEELVRNQDDEFNYRIREVGGKVLLHPGIKSKYTVRSTPSGLWQQYFQYGYWKVRVMQKHPRQMSLRQFIPPTFVLSLIVSLILALTLSWGWIPLVAILGSYLAANFACSLSIAQKEGWQILRLLPIAFAIIHISYGLGFLVGLVKFANRWNDKSGKVPEWHH